jgi:hypothetical protein
MTRRPAMLGNGFAVVAAEASSLRKYAWAIRLTDESGDDMGVHIAVLSREIYGHFDRALYAARFSRGNRVPGSSK